MAKAKTNGAAMLALASAWARQAHSVGFVDTHIHADRWQTFSDRLFGAEGGLNVYVDAKLWVKQDALGVLHRGVGYEQEEINSRLEEAILIKIAAKEKRACFIVDCSPDIDGRAFRGACELRKKYKNKIQIDVGIYPIFGLKTWNSDRYQHLVELAPQAQFVVALPERDARGDHPVGFEGHIALLYELAQKHKLQLHVHVDQTNTPGERGTEQLINAIRTLAFRIPPEERIAVWGVHLLINSKHDEERFERVMGLKELGIGVICCPYAAQSMRQMRNHEGPISSCIAPVRECIVAEIPVSLGTDNTYDLLMPMPEIPILVREMDCLASALRYYNKNVLWKLARCEPLNATDRASVAQNLARDYEAFGLPNVWARFTD